jgi:arylsulfatase A-like enzyme
MLDMTSEDDVLSSIQPDKFAQLVSAQAFKVIPTPARRHYNVVMIIMESIRAQSTTLHNKDIDTTPFLSTFAKRGVFFENAYAMVDHTSKALVSMQCGIPPKPGLPIDEANPGAIPTDCLPGILGKLGYATAFFQPADGSFERRAELANNLGFDLFVGRDDLPTKGFQKVSYFGYEDDILIEPALQWVAKQQRPFFLTMLTWTAHHNYQVPSTFQSRRFDENDKLNDYLTAIAYTDRFVKKFINGYEQLEIPEETLFIIASDHGQGFGEHKLWMHNGIMYEEGLRIPLILVGPGGEESGRSRQGLRQQIDILPTVMQVLGYEIKGSDLQGKSLLNARGHDQLLFSTWDLQGALGLRNGNIKFISYYGQRPMEIFDLAEDPLETQNLLYENDMLKQEGESVKKELEAWQTQNQVLYEISEARNQGRTKELFALKNRVRKDPKDLEARIQLANQLYELYFIDAAEQEYNRLLSMVTNKRQKSIVYFNLGLTWARKKEPKVAVKYFESAARGGFVHSELWNHIGIAYRDLGDIEKARAAFQRSISLNKRSINSAYNLGKMLVAIGDRHGAKVALKEAQLRHLQSTNRNILIGLLIDSALQEAAE